MALGSCAAMTEDSPLIQVRYGEHEVNFGNILTPTQVKDPPTLVRWKVAPGQLYTLIFTGKGSERDAEAIMISLRFADPDAPSRRDPQNREYHHWLVINIPGNDLEKGETLSEYFGSAPREDSGTRFPFGNGCRNL